MSTGIQYPDGFPPDTSNLPPAYLPGDQELISLIDRNLTQPDVASQPPSSGLQLASSMGGGGESSDFNWITAIGAGLQSAGAAHFGNFNVPQQYFQLKQQRDQMAAQAEERKQAFAMQQAKLAEEQKQHAFQQVTAVLTNKDASESQKATLLEELAKGNNPQIAQFARTAMDGIGKKRLSRIGLYMDRYPGQMQKLAEGMMKGSVSSDDIDARLGLIDEIEKHNAKITGEMELENEIKNNPNAPPGAKSWLAEREAKRMKEQAEANVKSQTQQAEIENANLKPKVAAADLANKQAPREVANGILNDQGQTFTDIFNPQTGKTDRTVGMPLQRTQEVPASVVSKAMSTVDNIKTMQNTIASIRQVLTPEGGGKRDDLVGVVGALKGLVYGASAQGDAMAQWLRGGAAKVAQDIGEKGHQVNPNAFFDPSLSKADLLLNILAYQQASIYNTLITENDFKNAQKSLGVGKMLTGVDDIMARLDAVEDANKAQMKIAEDRLSQRGPQQAKPQGEQPRKFKSVDEYKEYYGLQ